MVVLISITAILLYLVCTGLLFVHARRMQRGEPRPSTAIAFALWTAALVTHGVAALQLILTPQGLDLGFFHALSAVAWFTAALLLITSLGRPVENIGLFVLPIAALTVALEAALPEARFSPEPLAPGLDAHIFISLVGYSLLTLAAVQAGVLYFQNRHLHQHQPVGWVRALPPLQHMESLLFRLIALGFVLLSLALITGFIFLEDIFAQHQVHKTVLSIAAWIIFATLLFGRWRFGWRGRIAIRWTLGGFFALMLAYFGSKLVLELVLQR
jgi:ABC-type uncharacterized transport system permease subunit